MASSNAPYHWDFEGSGYTSCILIHFGSNISILQIITLADAQAGWLRKHQQSREDHEQNSSVFCFLMVPAKTICYLFKDCCFLVAIFPAFTRPSPSRQPVVRSPSRSKQLSNMHRNMILQKEYASFHPAFRAQMAEDEEFLMKIISQHPHKATMRAT